jgi:hypothetical protein
MLSRGTPGICGFTRQGIGRLELCNRWSEIVGLLSQRKDAFSQLAKLEEDCVDLVDMVPPGVKSMLSRSAKRNKRTG